MFQLREEHQQAFAAAAMAAFERRAVAHIRSNFPRQSAPLTDAQIRLRIRRGLAQARKYGLETERQGMCFVDTGFLLGPDFDSRPDTAWTREILNQPDTPADDRASRLVTAAQRSSLVQGG
jgi:hypothetical protein